MPVEQRSIGHFERMLHLRKVPVLGTLVPAHLSLLAEITRERFWPRGTIVFREDKPPSAAYYLVDGAVEVSRPGAPPARLGAGCELGGLGLLARAAEAAPAAVLADTLALEVEGEALFELFEDEFPILHHVLREVCRQLIVAQKRGPRWPPTSARPPLGPEDLDLVERIFYLRQSPPLARASINALAELSRGLVEVRFEPGDTVWQAGHSSDWVLLVVEGQVRGTLLRGDQFVVGPGAPLGVLEAVAEVPRWYTATAVTRVRALQGNIEGLIDVFEDNFEMASEFLTFIARLLAGLDPTRG